MIFGDPKKPAKEKKAQKDVEERPVVSPETGRDFLDQFYRGNEKTEKENPVEDDRPLDEQIIDTLKQIYDPEIPVNIYDLGLIYDVDVDKTNNVIVTMTLTTPHCPVAETMPAEVETRVRGVKDTKDVTINLVWDPPWDPSRMTEEARLELGFL